MVECPNKNQEEMPVGRMLASSFLLNMADKSVYLNNNEEQISAQKRDEQRRGQNFASVIGMVGGAAAFMLIRRKVNLARAFSAEVKTIGNIAGKFDRYAISEIVRDKNANLVSRWKSWGKNIYQGIKAPIPTIEDQIAIESMKLRKQGVPFMGIFPGRYQSEINKWSKLKTLFSGPAAALPPRAPITTPQGNFTSGKYGGIIAGGSFYKLGKGGEIASVLPGVHAGIMGTSGERAEFLRVFGSSIKEYKTASRFVRGTIAPMRRDLILEQRRIFLENFLSGKGVGISRAGSTNQKVIDNLMEQVNRYRESFGGPTASGLLKDPESARAMRSSYKASLRKIISTELKKPSTSASYKLYKLQMRLGVGEPFSAFESGGAQQTWREMRESLGMVIKDPVSGRPYPIRGRRYLQEGVSLSGFWSPGVQGKYYAYQAQGSWKRGLSSLVEGTFFKTLEQTAGIGLTVRPNKMTTLVGALVGAQPGSWGDFFVRRYLGGFGRLAALGVGGFTTFKIINYLARQATGGWGISDVAGKMYTSSREFQQHVLDQVGVSEAARRTERAFPGTMKSPLAMIARATAPYWMTRLGGRVAGPGGAKLGLALGIATALITWGDITQSPEELHRIYTGEQDIPVRKGRYWMFGRTPLGGGKISYWRPHWYPLLRSHYKYRGQLWDSETEELAQGSPLSPILAPILQGRSWDPYYWEKKHYRDRPYPLTAELFEPTAPFSAILNATVGDIIKPQKVMHPEYWGAPQQENDRMGGSVPGSASAMGMDSYPVSPMVPKVLPNSPSWLAGEGMYALTEQMGLRGYFLNTLNERMTGRSDFLPQGPVAESARRATGYERGYWDLNIGDPAGVTEFWRRILPHRRKGIETYNPIPNTMPDWLPGEDYFVNFRSGDPYTKVEMGEARLPGAGYESLHRLHSGIPKVYDAVDRYLILADIAPYSKEYTHYMYLAQSMARKDPYWSQVVQRADYQKKKAQEEYEFLSLTPPDEVSGILRPASFAYRRALSLITGPGSTLDPYLGIAAQGLFGSDSILGKAIPTGIFSIFSSPISKFLPYKTAEDTYRQNRVLGDEFTEWGKPVGDFIIPSINRAIDVFTSMAGHPFVPPAEQKRREYEEYFDRLEYIKYKKLENMAVDNGNSKLASRFRSMSQKTMTGLDPYGAPIRLMGGMPKRERAFFAAFSQADGGDRDAILGMVSPQMARIYRAQWAMRDSGNRGRVNSESEVVGENLDYFKNMHVPDPNWGGWNPEVDLKDVQLKTVRNEGMDIHKFDLWESREMAMERKGAIPDLGDIHQINGSMENLRRSLGRQMENDGFMNIRTFVTHTPASQNSVNLRLKVKRDRSKERSQLMGSALNA